MGEEGSLGEKGEKEGEESWMERRGALVMCEGRGGGFRWDAAGAGKGLGLGLEGVVGVGEEKRSAVAERGGGVWGLEGCVGGGVQGEV